MQSFRNARCVNQRKKDRIYWCDLHATIDRIHSRGDQTRFRFCFACDEWVVNLGNEFGDEWLWLDKAGGPCEHEEE